MRIILLKNEIDTLGEAALILRKYGDAKIYTNEGDTYCNYSASAADYIEEVITEQETYKAEIKDNPYENMSDYDEIADMQAQYGMEMQESMIDLEADCLENDLNKI